ncbi:hypothetical protein EON79_20710 [bacterium]|nr:MAG: hypothetical protein EON79_20710 [bacterium]
MRADVCLLLATLLIAPAARAQDVGGAVDLTGMGIYGMEEAVKEAAGGKAKKSGRPKAAPARLTFIPSAAQRKQNLAAYVAKIRTKDPAGADRLQKMFAERDVFGMMGQKMGPVGLRTNNVADAYALWWVVAYSAAHGKEVPMNRALLTAVRAQTVRAFGSASGASKLTDAVKQRVAESCLLEALMIDTMMESARGKSDLIKAIGQAVRQGARNSGVDLDTYQLTAKGFVPRK